MVTEIYRNRPAGLTRLVFSYPVGNKIYADVAPLVSLSLSLSVADDVKPAP